MVPSGRSRIGADSSGMLSPVGQAWRTATLDLPASRTLDRRDAYVARALPVATRLEWREGVNPAVGAVSTAVGGQQMNVRSFSAWESP